MKETNENMKKAALMKPKTKNDAVWLAGLEICGFINFSGVARKYFNRTAQWLTQRLHGNEVMVNLRCLNLRRLRPLQMLYAIWLHDLLLLLIA